MNNIGSNPIVIDTPDSPGFTTEDIRVRKLRWVSPSAQLNDRCVVADYNGNTFWETTATGNYFVEEVQFPDDIQRNVLKGLRVGTLDSGTLYIYQ